MAEVAREPGEGVRGSTAPDFTALAAHGLSLRPSTGADQAFEQALFASFRAEEFSVVPWPQAQKDAFLHQQFQLQHRHFFTHFAGADFWIVDRALPPGANRPAGRFYLDRSTPVWHVIDIGFLPEARGQGLGSALLKWAQTSAIDAGVAAIDLQVALTNGRAEKLYRSLGFQAEGNSDGFHRRMVWNAAPGAFSVLIESEPKL